MMKRHPPLQAALLLACTLVAKPAAAEHREHGAHLHGVGQMNLLLDGNSLEIGLESPAANLLGFEHAPRDAAEAAVLEQAVNRLHDAVAVFGLPQAAGCELESAEVASELLAHDGHKAGAEEAGHAHADFAVSYRFRCARPEALEAITTNLFTLFPATERLEVQLITPNGQGAAALSAEEPRLHF